MSLVPRAVFAGLATLLLAAPAVAQSGRAQGKVSGPDGQPLEGVEVKLFQPSSGLSRTLTTDAEGKWAVGGIEPGTWNIDFVLQGYVPRAISVPVGSRVKPIEIELERAGPPPEFRQSLEQGDAAFQSERWAEAREAYMKAIALASEHELDLSSENLATLYRQIAFCYNKEGNAEKELEYLQKLLEADPDSGATKALLAMRALDAGDLERGMKLLAELEQGAVDNPDVFFNVGVQLLNRDRREQAIEYFTKAVQLDPGYVDGYLQRGLTYFGLQKLDEAKADFEKVSELAPEGSAPAETARKVLESLKPAQ